MRLCFIFSLLLYSLNANALYHEFGQTGLPGQDGTHGTAGQAGPNLEVHIDDIKSPLNLAGEPGGDGTRGHKGKHARQCTQPSDALTSLMGASGGPGGRGGDGGCGGDGGKLTLLYHKLADLKKVTVDAHGGTGGEGKKGARGGGGCRCTSPKFGEGRTCVDGKAGAEGVSGKQGKPGRKGRVFLVAPKYHAMYKNFSGEEVATTALSDWDALEVEARRWKKKTGAKVLFADTSKIENTYFTYKGQLKKTIKLKWKVKYKTVDDFEDVDVEIRFKGHYPKEKLVAKFSGEFVHEGYFKGHSYVITAAHRPENLEKLYFRHLEGSGADLNLVLEDASHDADKIETTFGIVLESYKLIWYKERYKGPVPQKLVAQTEKGFRINLGGLPLSLKLFRPGAHLRITLSAHRKIGKDQADVVVLRNKELKVPKKATAETVIF